MRVAMTGATGLVGRACVSEFLARGDEVVRMMRSAATSRDGCRDIAIGDLGAPDFVVPEIPPCDVFVHAAARVPRAGGGDAEELFRTTNLVGTENALALCRATGARRFIFVSSIKVNGESSPAGRGFAAGDEPGPEDAYARSKLAAERLVAQTTRGWGISHVIVRPPLVYGPDATGNFSRLVRLAAMPVPLPFAMLSNRRAFVSDANLADLIATVAHDATALEGVVLASDGEALSTRELLDVLASAQGRPKSRQVPVPPGLLRMARGLPRIGGIVRRLVDDLDIDLSANPSELGWNPPHGTRAELDRAVKMGPY